MANQKQLTLAMILARNSNNQSKPAQLMQLAGMITLKMPKTKSQKSDQFVPCCQKGDKVCGKVKRAKMIQTAPKGAGVTHANLKRDDKEWVYTQTVRDHFFNPRNLLNPEDEESYKYDGVGEVGSPACGDVMKVWIRVKPVYKAGSAGSSASASKKAGSKTDVRELDLAKSRITDLKWQTFGCGSAISSTSMMSVMVTENGGMSIADAQNLKAMDINARLGGLPSIKLHCSILGDQALKKAIEDYLEHKTV